jgi:pimeloyl-ACP methyl ester carboxylesterase
MFEVLDSKLIRLCSLGDDSSLAFRRIRGNGKSPVICFLPWKASLLTANRFGVVPKDNLACYELPKAIVSSEPALCVRAFDAIIDDALSFIREVGIRAQHLVVMGLSVGTAPATYLANQIRARVYSVASADYGHLMLWESPATLQVKVRAVEKGYSLADFADAMEGRNPIENLSNLREGSRFLFGDGDHLVPIDRRKSLADAVGALTKRLQIVSLQHGHAVTMAEGVRLFETQHFAVV